MPNVRHVKGLDVIRPLSIVTMLALMTPLVLLPPASIFIYGTSNGLAKF